MLYNFRSKELERSTVGWYTTEQRAKQAMLTMIKQNTSWAKAFPNSLRGCWAERDYRIEYRGKS